MLILEYLIFLDKRTSKQKRNAVTHGVIISRFRSQKAEGLFRASKVKLERKMQKEEKSVMSLKCQVFNLISRTAKLRKVLWKLS